MTTPESPIKGFKLTSGEEIVCELRRSDGATYTIESPMLLEWEVSQSTGMAYDLMPWAYAHRISHTMSLSVFSVAAGPYEVRDLIANTYRETVQRVINAEETRIAGERHVATNIIPRRVSKRKA